MSDNAGIKIHGMLGPYSLGPNGWKENGISHGDVRDLADAIPDESVDLILTDPPFGIQFTYNSEFKDSSKDYPALVDWIVATSNRIIKPGGLVFVFVSQKRLREIWPRFPEDSRIFVAAKTFANIKPVAVQYRYDPALFWQKEGAYQVEKGARDWYATNLWSDRVPGSLGRCDWHACPKSLDLMKWMIERFSHPDDVVVDFFMGSGTTALAAKLTGRRYWGAEIIEDHVIRARDRVARAPSPLPLEEGEQLVLAFAGT